MSPENIIKAMKAGPINDQGAPRNATKKQALAEFLTGKSVGHSSRMERLGRRSREHPLSGH
jgi:hypothetical protein